MIFIYWDDYPDKMSENVSGIKVVANINNNNMKKTKKKKKKGGY